MAGNRERARCSLRPTAVGAGLTASIASLPSATLTIWRSLPAASTETLFSRSATEPWPSATLRSALAWLSAPSAVARSPDALLIAPTVGA